MKTSLLFLLAFVANCYLFAQHNYDNQSVIYSKSGNLGISTTNPLEKLHVNGKMYMNAGEGFKLYGDANYFGQYRDGIVFQMEDGNSSNGSTDGGFVFRGFTRKDQISKDWMVIKTGGKVGIGTNTPTEKFEVAGNSYIHGNSKTKGHSITNGNIDLYGSLGMRAGEGFKIFGDANYFGQYRDGIIFQMEDGNAANGTTDGGFVFRGYTRKDQISQDWMVIKTGGKVGIGTNNPTAKLSVNGHIHTKEVRVYTAGWADFVFKKDYQLPSLQEVAEYIKENGHLKDIPNEETVEKEGIHLGEMNTKLLQKIEELTLYTLQQQTQIDQLAKDNAQLKSENQLVHSLAKDLEILKKEIQQQKK